MSTIAVTAGSGTLLHTETRTVSAQTVHAEYFLPAEYVQASYSVTTISGVSAATTADHIIQVMAGASLNVRIRRIYVDQVGLITAAAALQLGIYRLSTAGTGGTSITPQKLDTGDTAAGATAMTLPTAKGTEGALIAVMYMQPIQTAPAGGLAPYPRAYWEARPDSKPIIIPAGTSNGIAVKVITGRAGLSVAPFVEFVETSFT